MASAAGISNASMLVGHITLPGYLGGNNEQVPLRAHALLGVVPALALLGVLAGGGGASECFLAIVAAGPGLFGTVLVHEVGHLLAATRRGAQPVEILLWPLGGLAVASDASNNPRDRMAIAAAGPATHAPMGLFWLALALATACAGGASCWFAGLFTYLLWLNVYMCAFNLLVPCFPLDCSQIACAYALSKGKTPRETAAAVVAVSVPIALGLGAWGLWAFITTGSGALTVFVALWLGKQTADLHRAKAEDRLPEHPLFRASPASPAATAVPAASPLGAGGTPGHNHCSCGTGLALALLFCPPGAVL